MRTETNSRLDYGLTNHPWQIWLLLPVLLLATLAAYQPVWHGGMLWDDDGHITAPNLRTAHGLRQIWFDPFAAQQYYPLTHTAFWLQYRLWGDGTLGYHLVSIILHALAAFLVALILRELNIPGAILAAVIFALHPVHVESVAWISGLKNTLSCMLYLSAMLAYVHFDRRGKIRIYILALALFLLALLSKTVTATLPAALLVVFWWKRGRLSLRYDVWPLFPFFAFGVAAGLFTAWIERTIIGAQGAGFQFTFVERLLIAGRAFWFYLGKLLWPANLVFIYPRWKINPDDWLQFLYPAGVVLLIAGLWFLRKRSRASLAAMLLFGGTLFPALGFFNVFSFRFSFVADHFQHLASLGIITLFSAGIVTLFQRWHVPAKAAVFGMLVLAGILAFSSRSYSRQFVDIKTLYSSTIKRNPSCWLAYLNLGKLELHDRNIIQAMVHLREALRLKPDLAEAHYDMGLSMHKLGRLDEAIAEYRQALRFKPNLPEAYNNIGNALQEMGRVDEAIPQYELALRLDPDFVYGLNNLGYALQKKGRLMEAAARFREALRLKPDYADAQGNLTRTLLLIRMRQKSSE
jgi:protein O-mannosyl-transferase